MVIEIVLRRVRQNSHLGCFETETRVSSNPGGLVASWIFAYNKKNIHITGQVNANRLPACKKLSLSLLMSLKCKFEELLEDIILPLKKSFYEWFSEQ